MSSSARPRACGPKAARFHKSDGLCRAAPPRRARWRGPRADLSHSDNTWQRYQRRLTRTAGPVRPTTAALPGQALYARGAPPACRGRVRQAALSAHQRAFSSGRGPGVPVLHRDARAREGDTLAGARHRLRNKPHEVLRARAAAHEQSPRRAPTGPRKPEQWTHPPVSASARASGRTRPDLRNTSAMPRPEIVYQRYSSHTAPGREGRSACPPPDETAPLPRNSVC